MGSGTSSYGDQTGGGCGQVSAQNGTSRRVGAKGLVQMVVMMMMMNR